MESQYRALSRESIRRLHLAVLPPVNLEYEYMKGQPYNIGQQPVPTFVARQHNEA